jgi:23S rRNA (pseudouridine1915-N3)-methyltransferase
VIYCVFIGPTKDKRLKQFVGEFQQRLERLWPITLMELPEKPKDILKWIEGKQGRGLFVSLDAHGQSMDSKAFSQWVTQSPRDIYFFGWGAEGPPPQVPLSGFKSLSLSPMTFSHEMARLLLLEQLYRAGSLLRGHPYPK